MQDENKKLLRAIKANEDSFHKVGAMLSKMPSSGAVADDGGNNGGGGGGGGGAPSSSVLSDAAKEVATITDLVRVVVDQGPRRAEDREKKHAAAEVRRVKERGALLQEIAHSRAKVDHAVSQRQAILLGRKMM